MTGKIQKAYLANKKTIGGVIGFEPKARGCECVHIRSPKRVTKRAELASQQLKLINSWKGNPMQKVDMQVMTPVINQKDAARDASNKPVPPTPRRKRRGLGMTDSGYVVLLTVFALVSVTTLFLTVRGNIRDNNMAQLFVQLVGNVEASFANTSTYPSTDLIPLLDAGGYIPASARAVASDGTVSIVTPYGHTLGISGTGSGYYIDIANLSKKACVKLLENAVVSSPTAVKGVSINTKAQTLPLTKTAIAAGCVPPNISIRVQF